MSVLKSDSCLSFAPCLAAILFVAGVEGLTVPTASAQNPPGMLRVPGGSYRPFYPSEDGERERVETFYLDANAVTNAEYLAFVRANPDWKRSAVSRLFADDSYLSHWGGDESLGDADPQAPVVHVSWFAASSYCESRNARLPTEAEWEWVGRADERSPSGMTRQAGARRILSWYQRPQSGQLPPVRSTFRNVYGVWDLHGLVWEWVSDFNASIVSGDNRQQGDRESERFCGGAALGSTDRINYAAFMRFAFRSSLQASYSVRNLGFRCARDIRGGANP